MRRPLSRPWLPALAWGAAAIALVACGQSRPPRGSDAGYDAPASPEVAPATDGAPTLAIEFVAQGCKGTPPLGGPCRGTPPLSVTFSPLVSGDFQRFLWDFGDGSSPSSVETPTHVYSNPGSYTVTLVAGGGQGSLSKTYKPFVVVSPLGAGLPCDEDVQCGAGLRCVCAHATCGAAFPRGFCSTGCAGAEAAGSVGGGDEADAGAFAVDGGAALDDCGENAICVDLGRAPASAPLPWQGALCLARCRTDLDCAPGLSCRVLPAGPASGGGWVRACFSSQPRDVGATCRTATGTLDPGACVGGVCADLGAFGLCSADCALGGCPRGSVCATLSDGRALCLPACTPEGDGGVASSADASSESRGCHDDPLLGCVSGSAPGLSALLGVDASAAHVCAPRACHRESDCTPAGRCVTVGADAATCAWPPNTGTDGGAERPSDRPHDGSAGGADAPDARDDRPSNATDGGADGPLDMAPASLDAATDRPDDGLFDALSPDTPPDDVAAPAAGGTGG